MKPDKLPMTMGSAATAILATRHKLAASAIINKPFFIFPSLCLLLTIPVCRKSHSLSLFAKPIKSSLRSLLNLFQAGGRVSRGGFPHGSFLLSPGHIARPRPRQPCDQSCIKLWTNLHLPVWSGRLCRSRPCRPTPALCPKAHRSRPPGAWARICPALPGSSAERPWPR